jgi:hypothetical protein
MGRKTVELAKQQLKSTISEHQYKTLQEKKGQEKVKPERDDHHVEANDIVGTQKQWEKDNKTLPPSRPSICKRIQG